MEPGPGKPTVDNGMLRTTALLLLFLTVDGADPFPIAGNAGETVAGYLMGMPDVLSVWVIVRHIHADGKVIRDDVSHEHMPLREWVRIHGPITQRDVDLWVGSSPRPARRCVVIRYVIDEDMV